MLAMTRAFLSIPLLVALLFAACGSSSPEPEPTERPATRTPIPTRTRIPTLAAPTATATPSPVDDVVADILAVERDSSALLVPLGRASRSGGDLVAEFATLAERCESVPTLPRSFSHGDLWPKPFKDLDFQITSTCTLYAGQVVGEPVVAESITWKAFATVHYSEMSRLQDALPDLSQSQLRDTVADRQ